MNVVDIFHFNFHSLSLFTRSRENFCGCLPFAEIIFWWNVNRNVCKSTAMNELFTGLLKLFKVSVIMNYEKMHTLVSQTFFNHLERSRCYGFCSCHMNDLFMRFEKREMFWGTTGHVCVCCGRVNYSNKKNWPISNELIFF